MRWDKARESSDFGDDTRQKPELAGWKSGAGYFLFNIGRGGLLEDGVVSEG
jgi:hypothetical protein